MLHAVDSNSIGLSYFGEHKACPLDEVYTRLPWSFYILLRMGKQKLNLVSGFLLTNSWGLLSLLHWNELLHRMCFC